MYVQDIIYNMYMYEHNIITLTSTFCCTGAVARCDFGEGRGVRSEVGKMR